mgnify:CR=1 FL=1
MQFLNSLKTQMKFHNLPFNHWELDKPLNEGALQEICNAEIVDLNKININYVQHIIRYISDIVFVLYKLLQASLFKHMTPIQP